MVKEISALFISTKRQFSQLGQSVKKDAVFQLKHLSTLLDERTKQVVKGSRVLFNTKNTDLHNVEKNVKNMSPDNVLKRGYSITILNGKAVTNFQHVKKGDVIKTILHQGEITSTTNSISKTKEL